MKHSDFVHGILKYAGFTITEMSEKMGFQSRQALSKRLLSPTKIDLYLFVDFIESMGGSVHISIPHSKAGNQSLEIQVHLAEEYKRHYSADDVSSPLIKATLESTEPKREKVEAEKQDSTMYELTAKGTEVEPGFKNSKALKLEAKEEAKRKKALAKEKARKEAETAMLKRKAAEKRAKEEVHRQEKARKRIERLEAQLRAEREAEEKLLVASREGMTPAELDLQMPKPSERSILLHKQEVLSTATEPNQSSLPPSSFSPESDTPPSKQPISKKARKKLSVMPFILQEQIEARQSAEVEAEEAKTATTVDDASAPDSAFSNFLGKLE